MADAKPTGGVRNLRAMFENQNANNANVSTSPPSRGRSPATSNASGTERPISKVRASFVAVERPTPGGGAQIGLKSNDTDVGRQTPPTSYPAQWASNKENTSPPQKVGMDEGKKVETAVTNENGATKTGSPEEPAANSTPLGRKTSVKQSSLGRVAEEGTAAAAATPTSRNAEPASASTRSSPKKLSSPKKTPAEAAPTTTRPKTISTTTATKVKPKVSPTLPTTPLNGSPEQKKASPHRTGRPSAASHTKAATEASSRNSLPSSRTSAVGSSARTTSRTRAPSRTRTESKARTSTSAHPPLPAQQSPATSRPKPKSPTRPVRLPASATAPTASSAAKHGTATATTPATAATGLARKSSTLKKDRPPSAAATRPAAVKTTATSALKRQPSRASLPSRSHDKPSTSSPAAKTPSDSFLSRMMRPTASSASKTHDKTDVKSPPKKTPVTKPRRKSEESTESKSGSPGQTKDKISASAPAKKLVYGDSEASEKAESTYSMPETTTAPEQPGSVAASVIEEAPVEEETLATETSEPNPEAEVETAPEVEEEAPEAEEKLTNANVEGPADATPEPRPEESAVAPETVDESPVPADITNEVETKPETVTAPSSEIGPDMALQKEDESPIIDDAAEKAEPSISEPQQETAPEDLTSEQQESDTASAVESAAAPAPAPSQSQRGSNTNTNTDTQPENTVHETKQSEARKTNQTSSANTDLTPEVETAAADVEIKNKDSEIVDVVAAHDEDEAQIPGSESDSAALISEKFAALNVAAADDDVDAGVASTPDATVETPEIESIKQDAVSGSESPSTTIPTTAPVVRDDETVPETETGSGSAVANGIEKKKVDAEKKDKVEEEEEEEEL